MPKKQPKIVSISAAYDGDAERLVTIGLGSDGFPYVWRGAGAEHINGSWTPVPGRWELLG